MPPPQPDSDSDDVAEAFLVPFDPSDDRELAPINMEFDDLRLIWEMQERQLRADRKRKREHRRSRAPPRFM
eukprot:15037358-Alexandrium_andersonii.AAC.1